MTWAEELNNRAKKKKLESMQHLRPGMELEIRQSIENAAAAGKFFVNIFMFEGNELSAFDELIKPGLEKEGLQVMPFRFTYDNDDRGYVAIMWA